MPSNNAYMADYMLKRYHRRRAEAVAALGGKCADCGREDKFNFHHVDPSVKSFSIGKVLSGASDERVKAELAKCILLCVECHKKRHPPTRFACGTNSRYCQGCRCAACREASRVYMRQYKKKKIEPVAQMAGSTPLLTEGSWVRCPPGSPRPQ